MNSYACKTLNYLYVNIICHIARRYPSYVLSRLARLAEQNLTRSLTGRSSTSSLASKSKPLAEDLQLEQQRTSARLLSYAVLLFALYRLPFHSGPLSNPCSPRSSMLLLYSIIMLLILYDECTSTECTSSCCIVCSSGWLTVHSIIIVVEYIC